MIYGIGTDICDIRRMEATLHRQGERFVRKVLSEGEFAVWQRRKTRSLRPKLRLCAKCASRLLLLQLLRLAKCLPSKQPPKALLRRLMPQSPKWTPSSTKLCEKLYENVRPCAGLFHFGSHCNRVDLQSSLMGLGGMCGEKRPTQLF